MLTPRSPPPPNYYVDNLCKLLHHTLRQYHDLLNQEEQDVAGSILNLSTDAIRLFARILSRKGPVYFVNKLNYSEVRDRNKAIEEMGKVGLLSFDNEVPVEELLTQLTKSQITAIFSIHESGKNKSSIIAEVTEKHSASSIHKRLTERIHWVTLCVREVLDRYSLLFFGDRYHDLSLFVVRDLGIIRFESYVVDKSVRQFASRSELDLLFEWSNWGKVIEEVPGDNGTPDLQHYVIKLADAHPNRFLERLRSKLLNQIGQKYERSSEYDLAAATFRLSTLAPARERIARIFHKRKFTELRDEVLTHIRSEPWNKEEELFAQRFPRRIQQSSRYEERVVTIDDNGLEHPEQIAIKHYEQQGARAWHFENTLPTMLFGLAYWDWLYASIPGAFTNQFQLGPRDLYWPEFFEVRRHSCVDPLENPQQLITHIQAMANAKWGIANPFVTWNAFSPQLLSSVVVALGTVQIQTLLEIICSDLQQFRSGFPDLMVVYRDGTTEFVEVKAALDRVQRNQHLWLEELVNAKLNACVLRLVSKS